jgi:formylglycine-generating enzyme required for sulfatase activity
VVTAYVLFLSCANNLDNPFSFDNARIYLFLESSMGNRDSVKISDTVENPIRIGISGYLLVYIDSVTIKIQRTYGVFDTSFTILHNSLVNDTVWNTISLHSLGERTVTATAFLQKGKSYILTGTILALGKKILIISNPSSSTVKEGTSVFFSVKANGTPPLTFQWYKDGVPVTGATKDSLIFSSTDLATAGRYECVIKDQWGDSATSAPALLTVEPSSAQTYSIIVSSAGNGTVTPSGTQTVTAGKDLTIEAKPSAGYSFSSWSPTSNLTIENPLDSATKVLSVSSAGTATAHFVPVYQVTIIADGRGTALPSTVQMVKEGSNLQISAKSTAVYLFSKWSVTNGGLSIENSNDSITKILNITGNGTVKANFVARGMKYIPAGSFLDDSAHTATISKSFWMDSTEVTQAQYLAVMGVNPSHDKSTDNRPVETVPWLHAILYCNKLSKSRGLDTVYTYTRIDKSLSSYDTAVDLACAWGKNGYRLPTEDEWELAAHGGKQLKYPTGDTITPLLANISSSSISTVPVASYKSFSHPFDLYDLAGNVAEWCWDAMDIYGDEPFRTSGRIDYRGPISGYNRMKKGGSGYSSTLDTRCDYHPYQGNSLTVYAGDEAIGFRTILPVQ